MQQVANWIVPIAVAIIAAWMTAQLAFRRFRREKVFERKMDAYTELFAAVHEMQKFSSIWMHYKRTGQSFSDDKKKELHDKFVGARDKLEVTAVSKSWLISDECIRCVEDINKVIRCCSSIDAIMKEGNIAARTGLIDMRQCVRDELGLYEWAWRLKTK